MVRQGTGVWKSVTGLGKVQRRYLDAVSGQAGYFGIIEEGGGPAIATLRLKVESRKITEAERVIARRGDSGLNALHRPGSEAAAICGIPITSSRIRRQTRPCRTGRRMKGIGHCRINE